MTHEFETEIQEFGNRVGVALPFDPNEKWGAKPRHHVRGTINGVMVRGALAASGGRYFISLGPAWRRDGGVAVGDRVQVALEAEGPQSDELAPDFAAALDAEPAAKEFFLGLATFYRKGYLRWINATKRKPEERPQRIAEVVTLLKEGKKERK